MTNTTIRDLAVITEMLDDVLFEAGLAAATAPESVQADPDVMEAMKKLLEYIGDCLVSRDFAIAEAGGAATL